MKAILIWLALLLGSTGIGQAQTALPSGYLLASGSQITDGIGNPVRMACVNADDSLPADVANMRAAGFNCLRYSYWDALLPASAATPGSLLAMDAMVSASTTAGMKVIFTHRGNEGNATDGCRKQQKNGLWYDQNSAAPYTSTNNTNGCGTVGTVTYPTFKANWVSIASRYASTSTVIGFDLHQEPLVLAAGGASWAPAGICANCGTDVSGMCGDVGSAINFANPGVLVICEGPLNNGTHLLNGAALNAVAGTGFLVSDLSMAQASAISGPPANKTVFSAHDYPCNVIASCPSSGATNITAKNAAWGYLETGGIAPVFLGEIGCSCDGSNGQLTDDTNWATALTQYANGLTQTQGGTGGPTFTGTQQKMSTAWWEWGSQATANPNGTLTAGGTIKPGQQGFWTTLLYTVVTPPPSPTTWNPGDKSASVVLSVSNTVATSTGAVPQSVRSTTSKSSGLVCWEVASTTITNNWDAGLANSTYALNSALGLGGDSNGIGFDPNYNAPSPTNGIFLSNTILSTGTSTPSTNGTAQTECANLNTGMFWATNANMRASGNPWNNSATANPATGVGGASMSGLVCPCFIAFNDFDGGAVATLNATGPFAVSTPSGFSPWQGTVTNNHAFLLINVQ